MSKINIHSKWLYELASFTTACMHVAICIFAIIAKGEQNIIYILYRPGIAVAIARMHWPYYIIAILRWYNYY